MKYEARLATQKEFPPLCAEMPDGPRTLWVRGPVPAWDTYTLLAIVGSRKQTPYGRAVIDMLVQSLASKPVIIVSGLALGTDSYAHKAALKNKILTVCVPGSGIDDSVLYPAAHTGLAHDILASGGLLMNEFAPTAPAYKNMFLERNRIMAGMSHATLLIEAAERSGTLVTARLAMEYNRNVLVVPGPITSATSIGTNSLLKEGATPITSASDLLEALSLEETTVTQPSLPLDISEHEQLLLELLPQHPSKEALFAATHLSISHFNTSLTMLEIKGLVRIDSGMVLRI
jgi:DNA processing protein